MRVSFLFTAGILVVGSVCAAASGRARSRSYDTHADVRYVPDAAYEAKVAAALPERPGMFAGRLDDRAGWEPLARRPEAAGIIRLAEAAVAAPLPTLTEEMYRLVYTTGDRVTFETEFFKLRDRLSTLLVAEGLEGKGRFVPAILTYVRRIDDEFCWTLGAHQGPDEYKSGRHRTDLFSTELGHLLAVACDWLGERMPDDLRARTRAEVKRRILDVYATALETGDYRRIHWVTIINNWNAVCHANVVGAALILEDDRNVRARFCAAAAFFNRTFLSGYPPDGYCTEGASYWNYGYGHNLILGLLLRRATGGLVDIFADPRAKAAAAYARDIQLADDVNPMFADCGTTARVEPRYWALMRQVWPDLVPVRTGDVSPLSGGQLLPVTLALQAFGAERHLQPPTAAGLPKRSFFPESQVLVSRADGFAVAMKGGHNREQHNHNDLGTYSLEANGQVCVGDSGATVYTRDTFGPKRYTFKMLGSYGHPVPLVAGKEQEFGAEFRARVLRTDFTDARDVYELDLAGAYSVEGLERLRRVFAFDRSERTFVARDEVKFASPQRFAAVTLTPCAYERGASDAEWFVVREGVRLARLTVTATGGAWHIERERIDNPNCISPERLSVVFDDPVAEASAAFEYRPLPPVFDPSSCGRANRAALQAMLDRRGTVRLGKPGRYRLSGTVFIGSDTRLECAPGVVLVKVADEEGPFSHVILNRGALTKTWDRNITVAGLEIAVNGVDCLDWQVYGLRGQMAFHYAKDVKVTRFRCLDLGRAQYCLHFCNFEDVIVDDVRIEGLKDGVHFGTGRRFTVRNGVFDTGDDPIALNAHDYSTGNPELGWIEDGVVENCHDLYTGTRHVGFFCRILAGAWRDWFEGMDVQQSDTVVSDGNVYRVQMPVVDGKHYVSKTRPTHASGQVTLDGNIVWGFVQSNALYTCGVRNVMFRDIYLHQPRTAFSVHYDMGKYSRSYYPGAEISWQENLFFDNIRLLHDAKLPFLSVSAPVRNVRFSENCTPAPGSVVTNRLAASLMRGN